MTSTHMHQFELHVTSAIGFPDISLDFIQYKAPIIIKLEAGSISLVPTGVSIHRCAFNGNIRVSISDKYKDLIEVQNEIFHPYHKNEFIVQLHNKSNQYIRVDSNEKIFKYEWIASEDSMTKDAESQTDPVPQSNKAIQTVKEIQTNTIQQSTVAIQTDPIEEFTLAEPVETVEDSTDGSVDSPESVESVVEPIIEDQVSSTAKVVKNAHIKRKYSQLYKSLKNIYINT